MLDRHVEADGALVCGLAAGAPAELRHLRARLMLEHLCESLGVEETACPACGGTGWLDGAALEFCPLCCGFREVPDRLADWFKARAAHACSNTTRKAVVAAMTNVE